MTCRQHCGGLTSFGRPPLSRAPPRSQGGAGPITWQPSNVRICRDESARYVPSGWLADGATER